MCDALGNPTALHLTPGHIHDLEGADVLLKDLPGQCGALIADKAYDAGERVLEPLAARNIDPVIPSRAGAKNPREIDKHLYARRHLIENFFNRLKQYRAIATRYDKRGRTFLSALYLASTLCWLI